MSMSDEEMEDLSRMVCGRMEAMMRMSGATDRTLDLEQATRDAMRTEPSLDQYGAAVTRAAKAMPLLHAAIGLCTEAGEFLSLVKKHVFYGSPLETAKLHEEGGDITWYLRIAAARLGGFQAMIQDNVEKLRKRFPDAFTEQDAVARVDMKDGTDGPALPAVGCRTVWKRPDGEIGQVVNHETVHGVVKAVTRWTDGTVTSHTAAEFAAIRAFPMQVFVDPGKGT